MPMAVNYRDGPPLGRSPVWATFSWGIVSTSRTFVPSAIAVSPHPVIVIAKGDALGQPGMAQERVMAGAQLLHHEKRDHLIEKRQVMRREYPLKQLTARHDMVIKSD